MEIAQSALLLIDVQEAFNDPKWGTRNNLFAEQNIGAILQHFRNSEGTVIHVQHISDNPKSLFYEEAQTVMFKPEAVPLEDERIIQKKVNSAFIGTNLKELLESKGIQTLFIVGLTTPHCVSTTTRMAGNFGFNCFLVEDATASFELRDHKGRHYTAQEIQDITLATLHEEFAQIIGTNDLIKELLIGKLTNRD